MRSPVRIWLAAPKQKAHPFGWAFLFLSLMPDSNDQFAMCRWHIAATSSKTGGFYTFCRLRRKGNGSGQQLPSAAERQRIRPAAPVRGGKATDLANSPQWHIWPAALRRDRRGGHWPPACILHDMHQIHIIRHDESTVNYDRACGYPRGHRPPPHAQTDNVLRKRDICAVN